MKPEVVFTKAAPKTGFSEGTESPIAQGVKCGDFVFVSGQGPLDPVTTQIVSEDIAEQTRVALDNVRAVLEAAGTSIDNVVVVDGDPGRDIRALGKVRYTLRAGRVLYARSP